MRILCGMMVLLGMMAPMAHGQGASGESAEKLRKTAHAYYMWRNENDPVGSSDQGLHTWDDKLGDYSESAIAAQRKHLAETVKLVKTMRTDSWPKEDKIDWLLFRAQLERAVFFDGLLPERRDPQTYTNECSNAIFSLLKKEYAPGRTRAQAATARLKLMPGLLEQGKKNLTEPVRLYAQLAIQSARMGDSLYTDSLAPLASELTPTEKQEFVQARDAALAALHGYADWLEQRQAKNGRSKVQLPAEECVLAAGRCGTSGDAGAGRVGALSSFGGAVAGSLASGSESDAQQIDSEGPTGISSCVREPRSGNDSISPRPQSSQFSAVSGEIYDPAAPRCL
jgi:hypothetical protein